MAFSPMKFSLIGLFQVNLFIFHQHIWVLRLNFVVIQVLIVQLWVADYIVNSVIQDSCSGSLIKTLDDLLSLVPVGLKKVGSVGKGLVQENLEIVVFLGICQTPGMVVVSMVLVSAVPNKIDVWSRLVQTSPAMESIILVPA
ncbi:MAG: hypothetical protein EZS28_032335, partial [Streblomastix strix]